MVEITYKNTLEDCVDCFIYTITKSDRYKRSVSRKSYILAFLFLLCTLYALDNFLRVKELGQTNILLAIITGLSLLMTILSLTYFRVYYAKRRKKAMRNKMANAKDSFNKEITLKVDETELTVGSGKNTKTYPLGDVEEAFEYKNHFCLVLENGAAIVVPEKYLKNKDEKEELHRLLLKK